MVFHGLSGTPNGEQKKLKMLLSLNISHLLTDPKGKFVEAQGIRLEARASGPVNSPTKGG